MSRTLALTVTVAVAATGGLLLTSSPALAEETTAVTYCGTVVGDVQPGQDPFAALQQQSDMFYDGIIGWLGDRVGLGPETICVPAHWVIAKSAEAVVTRIDPTNPVIKLIKITKTLNSLGEVLGQPQPGRLPDVGASGISAPVAWTGGQGLRLHSAPGTEEPVLTVLPEGTTVTIACQVSAGELWSKVDVDGQEGYVADHFLDTGTNGQVAAGC